MWVIAGLGNPGKRYEQTRHNIGFEVLTKLAQRHMQGGFRAKFGGETASGRMQNTSVVLLRPLEFMNNSGFAVQRALDYHQVPPEKLLVIHDELDLAPARIKLKSGGGHGGNNGLRSIITQLGCKEFLRIRVGIGKPPHKAHGEDTAGYVLSSFPKHELSNMQHAIDTAADAAEAIVSLGMTAAMNTFNTTPSPGVNAN